MGVDRDETEKPCTGLGDLFFSEIPEEIEAAKSICHGCNHGVWCAEQALQAIADGENGGVWAGMTLVELEEGLRNAERKRARRAGHPSAGADAVSELRTEPGHTDRDLHGVSDRSVEAPRA